jgi:hypothetical protein
MKDLPLFMISTKDYRKSESLFALFKKWCEWLRAEKQGKCTSWSNPLSLSPSVEIMDEGKKGSL